MTRSALVLVENKVLQSQCGCVWDGVSGGRLKRDVLFNISAANMAAAVTALSVRGNISKVSSARGEPEAAKDSPRELLREQTDDLSFRESSERKKENSGNYST
ncbi:hypothetical protein MHYP_G00355600 [Metynnis hypsauchen]